MPNRENNLIMQKYIARLSFFFTALFFCACGGPSEVRVVQGSEQVGNSPTGTLVEASQASIVHVDRSEKIATMRHGRKFPEGDFLQAIDSEGLRSSVLKAQPDKPTGLRTAFILEGEPQINETVVPVTEAEYARLAEIYPEVDAE